MDEVVRSFFIFLYFRNSLIFENAHFSAAPAQARGGEGREDGSVFSVLFYFLE